MIAFRDRMARDHGFDLLVHTNEDGVRQGINPFTHGSALYTDVMKTEGLKQALDHYQFDAAFAIVGIPRVNGLSYGICITQGSTRGRVSVLFLCPTGRNSTSGNISIWRIFRSSPSISPKSGPSSGVMAC